MERVQVSAQDGFFYGIRNSKWYENLEREGSCLELFELLRNDLSLVHGLGPDGITVLHKGVQHGCVALVRFILVDIFDDRGHCKCSLHGTEYPLLTREGLLRKACSYGSTAVNMAVVSGSPKMVLLLEWAINMSKRHSVESRKELSSGGGEESSRHRDFLLSFEESSDEVMTTEIPIPDVTDEDMNILDSSSSIVSRKVISVIDDIVENNGDLDRSLVDTMKERCEKDVDFEFVPVAHVFLHFLFGMDFSCASPRNPIYKFREVFFKIVLKACISDHEYGKDGSMVKALFNLLDPRGRTMLHAFLERGEDSDFLQYLKRNLCDLPLPVMRECVNAKDGAGRSIFHLLVIKCETISDGILFIYHMKNKNSLSSVDMNLSLKSLQDEKLNVLKDWCFPSAKIAQRVEWKPLQLAIIFNLPGSIPLDWCLDGFKRSCDWSHGSLFEIWLHSPFLLAALLGRTKYLELFLEHFTREDVSFLGEPSCEHELPAIHCAAYFGQVEALQTILKFRAYDPLIQDYRFGTALHLLLNDQQYKLDFDYLHTILLFHLLPNSKTYQLLKNDFVKFQSPKWNVPRMFSANEISCINLLLQAGIDIWTPHCWTKEMPSVGPMANDEARKWWYEKVVHEVISVKTSVSYAANATSVVAALVSTASFIGPLQPPLGYGDVNGYVRTDQISVRVYFVCNGLSFFFSIASILMALLPAIPMPKESLYDEMLRSQRCLKGATLMLLIAIICILISFSSASMAVVSPEWRERQVVVACILCGGLICIVVLAIYVIRMLRMVFHRNDWFRMKFAKYMFF